jgi:hypothetical protein
MTGTKIIILLGYDRYNKKLVITKSEKKSHTIINNNSRSLTDVKRTIDLDEIETIILLSIFELLFN